MKRYVSKLSLGAMSSSGNGAVKGKKQAPAVTRFAGKLVSKLSLGAMSSSGNGAVKSKKYATAITRFAGKRGMALMMALSFTVFTMLVVQETIFETQTEYRSARAELESLRAYYAAKAGMELNLLRLKTYTRLTAGANNKKATTLFRTYLDLLWKFPIVWPPPVLEELSQITQDEMRAIEKNSFLQSRFYTSIEPTVSRLDVNDLASPVPSLREWTFQVLSRLIVILRERDKQLREEVSDQDIVDLLENIKDWVDPDTQIGGGSLSESSLYDNDTLPPNRSFLNVEELSQVKGMSARLYKAIKPFVTVYGEKGIDVNTASIELLQALHQDFTLELAQEVYGLTHVLLSPFIFTKESFEEFLTDKGFENIKQDLFPSKEELKEAEEAEEDIPISYIYFDALHNFQIKSIGSSGKSQKTITAIYFHPAPFQNRFRTLLKEDLNREESKIAKSLKQSNIEDKYRESAKNKKGKQGKDLSGDMVDSKSSWNLGPEPTIIYWKEEL